MARSRELKIQVVGDDDRAHKMWKRQTKDAQDFGKQTKLTASITSKGYSAMRVGATGAAAALGGLAIAGKKVVEAAIESEKSSAKLRAQLKALDISYDENIKRIDKVIQKTSQLAGLDDEDLQDAFTNIVRATGDVNVALKDMALVADLARSRNMDVAKAGELVAKVHAGSFGPLRRLGLEFEKTTFNVDKLKASQKDITPVELAFAKAQDQRANSLRAINQLQDAVAGQAEAYGRTTAGSVDRANVAFENLQETIGAALAPTVEDAATKVADFVNEMQEGTGQGGRFVDRLEEIWKGARPTVLWIGRATKNIAEFTAEHPGLAKLAGGVLAVGAAIKALRFASAATGFSAFVKAGTSAARLVRRRLVSNAAAGGAEAASESASAFGKSGKFRAAGKTAGRAFGRGLVVGAVLMVPGIVHEIEERLADQLEKVQWGRLISSLPGKIWGAIKDRFSGSLIRGQGRQMGGLIGGQGRGDIVPAMLEPGEFVIRRKVVEQFGPTFFADINAQRFARGGPVKHNARYYRNRFGKDYRGFYLWGEYGQGSLPRPYEPASRWGDGALLPYFGPGGFPGDRRDRMQWLRKWNRGDRYSLGGIVQHFTSGGIVARANKMDAMHLPYLWGGGHGGTIANGVDCSGAVSYALGVSPRVSGAFMSFGLPGPGSPNDTKVYANPKHVFAVFNGRGWGTSRENPGGGPGWLTYNHRSGFTIRHLEDGGAHSGAGDPAETVEQGKQQLREREQRAGSRAVNRIAGRFAPAISRATRKAAGLATAIEDADTRYGQLERRFGQTDEDLQTVGGKTARLTELGALAEEKRKQLQRMRKRAAALRQAVSKTEGLLKAGRRERDRARSASRKAKIRERLKAYETRLVDLRAELKALGVSMKDVELDVGDLAKEAREVAATPLDAPDAGPSVSDRLGEALGDVDLQERAGLLSSADAAARREQLRQIALAMPGLTDRERWQIMGDLRDATAEQTQATAELTAALAAATQAQVEANTIAQTRVAIGLREAERAITDLISGQLGYRVQTRSYGPGDGRLARL